MGEPSIQHGDCITVYEDGEYVGVAIRTENGCWLAIVPDCKPEIFGSRYAALHSIQDGLCADWFAEQDSDD